MHGMAAYVQHWQFLDTMGKRARLARESLGLSLDDVAARAGVRRSVVAAFELGAVDADSELLFRLADALGGVDVLFGDETGEHSR